MKICPINILFVRQPCPFNFSEKINDFFLSFQEWHRLSVPLENTSCPLCNTSVHVLELVPHLTMVHSVSPQATSHALLLWILTANQMRKQNMLHNPMHSAMLLQSMLPTLKAPQVRYRSIFLSKMGMKPPMNIQRSQKSHFSQLKIGIFLIFFCKK